MSRNFRGRVFTPRWGRAVVGQPKVDKEAQLEYLNRFIKRMNTAAGYDSSKKPFEWHYHINGASGVVVAQTRSEARARIKEELGLSKNKRLPKGSIERGMHVE